MNQKEVLREKTPNEIIIISSRKFKVDIDFSLFFLTNRKEILYKDQREATDLSEEIVNTSII